MGAALHPISTHVEDAFEQSLSKRLCDHYRSESRRSLRKFCLHPNKLKLIHTWSWKVWQYYSSTGSSFMIQRLFSPCHKFSEIIICWKLPVKSGYRVSQTFVWFVALLLFGRARVRFLLIDEKFAGRVLCDVIEGAGSTFSDKAVSDLTTHLTTNKRHMHFKSM